MYKKALFTSSRIVEKMMLLGQSGDRGAMINETILKSENPWHCPFKNSLEDYIHYKANCVRLKVEGEKVQ
jgi:hypothetical protein